ncbi:hypothetical protein [Streptomyces griseorubiginosus]
MNARITALLAVRPGLRRPCETPPARPSPPRRYGRWPDRSSQGHAPASD